jgi:hypothetical protein
MDKFAVKSASRPLDEKRANREIARKISSPDIAGDKLYYRGANRAHPVRRGLLPGIAPMA